MDMLEKSPGISVDNDGNISLRGKQGVIVMIDGKPTYLSATDLANMLKNMPASALDQIEIMTNPSSKYDASGNSGIINIKTKKGKNNGFNGNFMIGATSSIYKLDDKTYFLPKSQNSFNYNYRKNKLNFFGNYNPNFFRGRNTLDFTSRQIDPADGLTKGYTAQSTKFKFGNFNQTLKLGLDWYKDKKNILGIVAGGFVFNGNPSPTTIADDKDVNGQLRSRLITYAHNDISFKNFTGNLNWKHTFDSSGKELTADQVRGIRYLVANAVEGMDADRVTVLDERGKVLTRESNGVTAGSDEIMDLKSKIETEMETRIENILGKVVGKVGILSKPPGRKQTHTLPAQGNRNTCWTFHTGQSEEDYIGDLPDRVHSTAFKHKQIT